MMAPETKDKRRGTGTGDRQTDKEQFAECRLFLLQEKKCRWTPSQIGEMLRQLPARKFAIKKIIFFLPDIYRNIANCPLSKSSLGSVETAPKQPTEAMSPPLFENELNRLASFNACSAGRV